MSEELEVQSETVARLLVTEPPPEIEPNQIWIVDEAGLLSAKDAHALLQRATQEQARLILVGDTRQLSAVSAGNPFKSLQQAGIKTAHLNESLRQKNPQLKLAVDLIADGRIKAGFDHLLANGSIKTVDAESKVEAIANDYIVGTPEQRLKTLVLAGTNTERLALTQAIRDKLKGEGTLGETATITQLQTKNLSIVQMRFAHNFEIGDVIMPTRDYKRRGLEKGKLYEVVGRTTDKLTLIGDNGQVMDVDTAFEKAVYQRNQIEIAVGDRLQWKKNDRQLGRRNGQEFTVTGIDLNIVQIKYADTRTECISLAQAQNLDYALVSTTYSSQGKTADRVLISADFTIGQESFYVAASRARHELKIYTEDPTRLVELAQQSKAKENALELLRKQVLESQQQQAITINISDELVAPVLKSDSVLIFQTVVNTQVLKTPFSPEEAETKPICQKEVTTEIPVVKLKEIELPPTVTKPHIHKPVLKPAVPTEAFWTPHHTEKIPNFIEPNHWQEFESSAIHPEIAALNFESLQFNYAGGEHEAWERLMISDRLKRTNTGRLTDGFIRAYSHLDAGGWWCDAGVDPRSFKDLIPGEKPPIKRWGCYKPNAPRPKKDDDGQIISGKFIKYEHPPKVELSIFLLNVPDEFAERIYSKHKVNPSESDAFGGLRLRQSGFWYCVWKHNIPCALAEGAKKAASLLSQGHAAIGLPGISAGYRTPKDEFGNKLGKSYLHEELAVFATQGRVFKFCFDYETKPETKLHIERDISVTGGLLQKSGAKVKVISLPGPDKGVDDLLVAQGPLTFELLNHQAKHFLDWQQQSKKAGEQGAGSRERIEQEEGEQGAVGEFFPLSPCTLHPASYQPPRKPIVSVPKKNQPQVQTNEFNRQQPNTNTVANREDRGIVNQSLPVESENRAVVNQQFKTEREDSVLGISPIREHEPNERESLRLLKAISGYLEIQEIEQLGADIARINQSLTDGWLRGQRATNFRASTLRENSGIVDRTESYGHSEQRHSKQLLNAITDFIEQSVTESALIETLPSLTKHLFQYQQQISVEKTKFDDLEAAIAYLEQRLLSQTTVDAIAENIEQSVVESALSETLPQLIKQFSQFSQQLSRGKPTFEQFEQLLDNEIVGYLNQKTRDSEHLAINAISDYVDKEAVASYEQVSALDKLHCLLGRSQSQTHTEFTTVLQKVLDLIEKLSHYQKHSQLKEQPLSSKLTTDIEVETELLIESKSSNETSDLKLESSIREMIFSLNREELVSLIEKVSDYFEQPFEENDPRLSKMRVIRQVIRDENKLIVEKLGGSSFSEIEAEIFELSEEIELLEEIALLESKIESESIRFKH